MEKSRNRVKVIRKEELTSQNISVVDASSHVSFNSDGSVVVTVPSSVSFIGFASNF